ncbi:MAG: glutaminyl-peptide cyclotransferase [Chitinophagaceae bacterium]|nr:glutaminyl-peptide cyclotransferase [Chitinophagaceae bacterium]
MLRNLLLVLFVWGAISCNTNEPKDENISVANALPPPATITYNIVATYPHDTSYYTEGFQLYKNNLFESTGNYGVSKLVQIDLKTGKPVKELSLNEKYFGEGLTVLNDTIYQMTYREKTGFVYDMNFKLIRTFTYDTEGWGMTTDGKSLIMSDGSSNLYYRDPKNFSTQKIVSVTDNNGPVANVNELELVDGYIYANIWNTDNIIKIDPSNGHVIGKMDFTGLLEKAGKPGPDYNVGNVLNGIAYDSTKKTLLITGKLWPLIFEVKL